MYRRTERMMKMGYLEEYRKWCTDPYFDEAVKAELKAIEGDEREIEEIGRASCRERV